MNKLFFLLCFTVFSFQLAAQETYFVTIVKGNVLKKDHSKIKPGTKLQLDDVVLFNTSSDMLILLHPAKGRFVLSPGSSTPASPQGEITMMIRGSLHYFVNDVRLSSRDLDDQKEIAEYFKINTKINNHVLIIDKLKIPVSGSAFAKTDNKENFFFLQKAAGKRKNSMLLVKQDTLLIEKEDFNADIDSSEYILGYVQNYSTEKKAQSLATFCPNFLSSETVKEIMQAIVETLPGKTKTERLTEVYTQLYFLYGKPNMDDLEKIYLQLKP